MGNSCCRYENNMSEGVRKLENERQNKLSYSSIWISEFSYSSIFFHIVSILCLQAKALLKSSVLPTSHFSMFKVKKLK